MHSSTLAALLAFLAVSGARGTPLSDLFANVHQKPMKLYQCFRNASTFEDPSAFDLTLHWSATGLPANEATSQVYYSTPVSHGRQMYQVDSEYVPQYDYAILTGQGITVDLYVPIPPYNGNGYLFKHVVTSSGLIAVKLYDTSSSCKDAAALRKQVCPDPCSLKPTRKIQSP